MRKKKCRAVATLSDTLNSRHVAALDVYARPGMFLPYEADLDFIWSGVANCDTERNLTMRTWKLIVPVLAMFAVSVFIQDGWLIKVWPSKPSVSSSKLAVRQANLAVQSSKPSSNPSRPPSSGGSFSKPPSTPPKPPASSNSSNKPPSRSGMESPRPNLDRSRLLRRKKRS